MAMALKLQWLSIWKRWLWLWSCLWLCTNDDKNNKTVMHHRLRCLTGMTLCADLYWKS